MTPEERRQMQEETRRLGELAYRRWRRLRWRIWADFLILAICLAIAGWAIWHMVR